MSPKQFYKSKFPRSKNFQGAYILISKSPKKVLTGSSKKLSAVMSLRSISQTRKIFLKHFRNKKFDQGLENAISFLSEDIEQAYNKPAKQQKEVIAKTSSVKKQAANSSGFSFTRIMIWGAIILCLIFLVGRLFAGRSNNYSNRSMNRNSNGNNTDTPPWNQGNSGGSGIWGGVLGGIGGALAGNYIYDKFFGSSSSTPTSGSTTTAAPTETHSASTASEPSFSDTSEPDIGDISGDFSSNDDWGGDFGDSGGTDDW